MTCLHSHQGSAPNENRHGCISAPRPCRLVSEVCLTLLELPQVGLQDRGVERQAASVQLAHKDILCLQLLQQGLDVLLRACQRSHTSDKFYPPPSHPAARLTCEPSWCMVPPVLPPCT